MNLTPTIRSILRDNLLARDSDHELIIQVLIRKGFAPTKRQLEILRELSFESIRRTRQKLQQAGEFLPSPRVAKQRKLKGMITSQRIVKTKAENIDKLIREQPLPLPWGKG